MATTPESPDTIDALAARCGLRSDDDNATSRARTVSPSIWFWGTVAECKRLASVLGFDQRLINDLPNGRHWELWEGDDCRGFVTSLSARGCPPMAECAIRVGVGAR